MSYFFHCQWIASSFDDDSGRQIASAIASNNGLIGLASENRRNTSVMTGLINHYLCVFFGFELSERLLNLHPLDIDALFAANFLKQLQLLIITWSFNQSKVFCLSAHLFIGSIQVLFFVDEMQFVFFTNWRLKEWSNRF